TGRPVVALTDCDSEVASLLKGCGLTVPNGDLEGFARAIEKLARDAELRSQLGLGARLRALDQFEKEGILAGLEAELRSRHVHKRVSGRVWRRYIWQNPR